MGSSLNGTGLTFNGGATLNSPPVTSIATGNGLSGGTITTTGTLVIAAPAYNTVGSYASGSLTDITRTVGSTYAAASTGISGASGTWRCMGESGLFPTRPGCSCSSYVHYYLWCRTA